MQKTLVNDSIRADKVRLIIDGENLGVIKIDEAKKKAMAANLDLVQISAGEPPVCKIMDYGKFRYDEQKKAKEQAAKQREAQKALKEYRMRPSTGENDRLTKVRQAKEYLEKGHKVQFSVTFKGREVHRQKDDASSLLQACINDLTNVSKVEQKITMRDRNMTVILAPTM